MQTRFTWLQEWVALHRWRVYGVLSIVLCGVIISIEIRPRISNIITDYKELAEKKAQLDAFSNGRLNTQHLVRQEKQLESELESLHVDASAEYEMARIIALIEKSREGLDVVLKRIEPQAPRTHGRYEEIPFTLIAEGTYKGIGVLIDRLETAPMSIHATRISRPAILSDPLVAELKVSSLTLNN